MDLFFFWSILSCSISPVLGKDLIVVSNLACLCFCCCKKHARSSGRSLRFDTDDKNPPPSIVPEFNAVVWKIASFRKDWKKDIICYQIAFFSLPCKNKCILYLVDQAEIHGIWSFIYVCIFCWEKPSLTIGLKIQTNKHGWFFSPKQNFLYTTFDII